MVPNPFANIFGFDVERVKPKSYGICKKIKENPGAYAELQALHAKAMEEKRSKKRRVDQKAFNDQVEEDAEFVKDGVNPDEARATGAIVPKQSAIAIAFAKVSPQSPSVSGAASSPS